jgi:hypothetical protein
MKPLETVNMREFATKPSKYVRKFEIDGGGVISRNGEAVGIYIPITALSLRAARITWEWYLDQYDENKTMAGFPEEQRRAVEVFRQFLAEEFKAVQVKQQRFTQSAKEEYGNSDDDDWILTSTEPDK